VVGLTLPILHLLREPRWSVVLLTAFFFGVWSFGLLLPNPLMPEAVRVAHFSETLSSNFVFGALVAWLFTGSGEAKGHVSVRPER